MSKPTIKTHWKLLIKKFDELPCSPKRWSSYNCEDHFKITCYFIDMATSMFDDKSANCQAFVHNFFVRQYCCTMSCRFGCTNGRMNWYCWRCYSIGIRSLRKHDIFLRENFYLVDHFWKHDRAQIFDLLDEVYTENEIPWTIGPIASMCIMMKLRP